MTRQWHTPASLPMIAALVCGLTLTAQTPIERHSNSYTPEQDVQLGRQAAEEVRRELPILRDRVTTQFVERVGEQLVSEIPQEFEQPAFRYTFEVVNLREINAFALPGGPMFLHRGMIEAAKTDAEVAGVMAHELSHVVLRHGTVQATKGQKFQIGAIAGQVLGAIIGGRTGDVVAQGTQFGLGAYFLRYGREYEREADLLGAQIMARAGYDPRQMANMFRTIQQQGGNRAPEWLSSHPDPGNRYDAINREAAMLRVEGDANTYGAFQSARASLQELPPAPTSRQVAESQQARRRETAGTTGRGIRVEPPSRQWRTYQPGSFLELSVPANWQQVGGGNTVTYAPAGGYVRAQSGRSALTHGLEIGVMEGDGRNNLQRSTEQLVQSFARTNRQLRRQRGYSRTSVGGRPALTTDLTNVSELTGEQETVNLTTVQLRDGSVLFMLGVAPVDQARTYATIFSRVRQTMRIQ